MSTYSEKLKDPRWQKKRLQILDRDNWQCQKCSDKETTLNVHHLQYNGNPWDADNKYLVTLCEDCHRFIEKHKGWNYDDCKMRKLFSADDKGKFLLVSHEGVFIVNMIDDNTITGFYVKKYIKDFLDLLNDANNYNK